MHRKYLIYIGALLFSILILFNNIFWEYESMENSVQVYNSSVEKNTNLNIKYLSSIKFIVNELKLYIEKISFNDSDDLKISIRVLDKKKIYDIVDNLNKNSFNVNSYIYVAEDNGQFIYDVEIGV